MSFFLSFSKAPVAVDIRHVQCISLRIAPIFIDYHFGSLSGPHDCSHSTRTSISKL